MQAIKGISFSGRSPPPLGGRFGGTRFVTGGLGGLGNWPADQLEKLRKDTTELVEKRLQIGDNFRNVFLQIKFEAILQSLKAFLILLQQFIKKQPRPINATSFPGEIKKALASPEYKNITTLIKGLNIITNKDYRSTASFFGTSYQFGGWLPVNYDKPLFINLLKTTLAKRIAHRNGTNIETEKRNLTNETVATALTMFDNGRVSRYLESVKNINGLGKYYNFIFKNLNLKNPDWVLSTLHGEFDKLCKSEVWTAEVNGNTLVYSTEQIACAKDPAKAIATINATVAVSRNVAVNLQAAAKKVAVEAAKKRQQDINFVLNQT